MTLSLLCRHTVSIQRAAVTQDPMGGVVRAWQPLLTNIAATILTARGHAIAEFGRRGMAISHVVLTPGTPQSAVGDRLYDGTFYYHVRFINDLGDRGAVTAIYVEQILPE